MQIAVPKGLNIFVEYIAWVKTLTMTVEYDRENDGTITGEVMEFCTIENAPTIEECEKKLIASMRETAQFFAEDFEIFSSGRPYEVPYVIKILFSSDAELKSCLHEKTCNVF